MCPVPPALSTRRSCAVVARTACALLALAVAAPARPGAPAAAATAPAAAARATVYMPVAQGGGAGPGDVAEYEGITFVAEGGAQVRAAEDRLVVREVRGPEPTAGFTAFTGDARGIELSWVALRRIDVAGTGVIELRTAGKVDGAPRALLGWSRAETADIGVTITADVDGAGAPAHRLEARLDGRLVAALDGHRGIVARAAEWPTGVGRLEGHVGSLPTFRWRWETPTSLNIPGGPVVTADELRVLGDAPADAAILRSVQVRMAGMPTMGFRPPVLRAATTGCPEAAPRDRFGGVAFPPERVAEPPPAYVDVSDAFEGYVDALYGAALDTSRDDWLAARPCAAAIGGELPPLPDLDRALSEAGLASTAAAVRDDAAGAAAALADAAMVPTHTVVSAVDAAFTDPITPLAPDVSAPYGGRDVVFVHGLLLDAVAQALNGDARARTAWRMDFDGAAAHEANAEFYAPGGFFRMPAEAAWAAHVARLQSYASRGRNRYLVVAWPSSARLDVGAHALLTQLADAMATGRGVVAPGGGDTAGFCQRPNCVIVSHGVGGLLSEVALDLAATGAFPGTAFGAIPGRIKAHVAFHPTYGGTPLATSALADAAGLSALPDSCAVALRAFLALDGGLSVTASPCGGEWPLTDSVLLDLVPEVTRRLWAGHLGRTAVPTLIVAGAHPTAGAPLAQVLATGLTDGVAPLADQCARPPTDGRPGRITVDDPASVFDPGVPAARALGYFLGQRAGDTAAGCLPWLTPTGMLLPVADARSGTPEDPLRRLPGHLTFLQSAADHVTGARVARADRDYVVSQPGGARNSEEARVLTDAAATAPDARFGALDPHPLLKPGLRVGEHTRGRSVTFNLRRDGKLYAQTWWLWRRTYLLAAESDALDELDYVYRHVLRP